MSEPFGIKQANSFFACVDIGDDLRLLLQSFPEQTILSLSYRGLGTHYVQIPLPWNEFKQRIDVLIRTIDLEMRKSDETGPVD